MRGFCALVDRDRFRPHGGQFERIGLASLVIAPPDRRPRLGLDLFHEAGGDQFASDLLRRSGFHVRRSDKTTIVPPRSGAQHQELGVSELDGHRWTLRVLTGPANPGPSLTRAPVRHDRRGLRVIRVVLSAGSRPYTRFLSNRTPVLSWRSSAWVNELANGLLTRIIDSPTCAPSGLADNRRVEIGLD